MPSQKDGEILAAHAADVPIVTCSLCFILDLAGFLVVFITASTQGILGTTLYIAKLLLGNEELLWNLNI